ncbi:hypothetical protein GIB67_016256 [Kingdonia uniflora]|uniref:isopentenyl-diphosphate Delta-isomerase n=1 Tax=Kingdonia uniflora TaxID=39325 RepID=A0A7J7LM50_9MAGN|nr:hypothetical protein GIB67_016256 [Kingdonia uniflora]
MNRWVRSLMQPWMVQKRLMFDDECILVDEHDNVLGHDSKYNSPPPLIASLALSAFCPASLAVAYSSKIALCVDIPRNIVIFDKLIIMIGFCMSYWSFLKHLVSNLEVGKLFEAIFHMLFLLGNMEREENKILIGVEQDAPHSLSITVIKLVLLRGHLMEKIEAENLLHRAFSVFLFNSKYELLLQQRSATKVTFPLVWTNTCCSHPLYRDSELIQENYLGVRNAAQRKLDDELGIPAEDVPVDEFTPLGRMLYKAPSDGKWGEHELDYLLFIVRDVKVSPNPDEVADIKYVNQEELKELLRKADAGEEGLKLSPWFRLVVDNFLFKWWDHVEKGTLESAVDMKTIHKL